MVLISAACLLLLYWRFSITDRTDKSKHFSVLQLTTTTERIYFDSPSLAATSGQHLSEEASEYRSIANILLPAVSTANETFSDNLKKLVSAVSLEFRLLRGERSLIVLAPLALLLSIFDVAFFRVVPEVSYSATYASSTALAMLLFLIGMSVFYTGEAMHRDRELRIEPVIWSTPAPNYVLLLSKFLATLVLALSFITLTGFAAITTQLIRRHPIEIQTYLLTYSIILLPAVVFLAACSVMLNVLLRNKYLVYATSIALASALFYLYGIGHNHWLYNPLAYRLWTYADLIGVNSRALLFQRFYWIAVAGLCLVLAHVSFARKHGRHGLARTLTKLPMVLMTLASLISDSDFPVVL
jgi:hypothetical protein